MDILRSTFVRLGALLLFGAFVLAACSPTTSNPNSTNPSGGNAPAATAAPVVPTTGAIVAPTMSAPAQAPAMPPASSGNTTIAVARTESLGHFLIDGDQRTLYVSMKDGNNTSNCNDTCAKTWPPLTVTGQPTAMQGLDDTLLGTIKRQDGTTQVTFNGHPLYYFSGDKTPGDTKGQGIAGNWYVVDFNGEPVKTSNAPSAAPTSSSSANPTRTN